MTNEQYPPRSSAQQPDDPMRDAAPGTPRRDSSPQRDDASQRAKDQRWDDELETDQMERLYGHEAIEDDEITDDDPLRGDSEDF